MIFLFFILTVNASISHIRVLFQENPSHEVVVASTIEGKTNLPTIISWDKEPGTCTRTTYSLTSQTRLYHGEGRSWLHIFNLKNLKANTRYYFCIRNSSESSKENYFITVPQDHNEPFYLLFGGDSRSDRENRIRINRSMAMLFEKNPAIYALVHGGDMVFDGSDFREFADWMDDHQLTTTSENRLLPLIITQGNHETDDLLFNDIFVLEGNLSRRYFSTKLGKVLIFNLNTNISTGGDQLQWLEAELKNALPDTKWLFANYHRPIYPAVKKPGPEKKFWTPIFEKYQFDLVFESDGHVLKKTVPIFEDKLDLDRGIIYVGEGGLGVKLREPKERWYLEHPGYAESIHHFFLLKIQESQVDVEVLKEDHTSFDTFTLYPRKRPI